MKDLLATNGDATIVVENLRHVYRSGTVALDGVDLEIGTGLFGLLGPNGAGKSTLMRILCTLLVPTAGRVTVTGLDVTRDRREVRQQLGYLPQEFGVWRLQRVDEALDTLALLSGLTDRATRRERVQAVLEEVGLEEVAHRKIKKLSGGMLRRLGVAQALVHEPAILIVDEPTVGLDPEERMRFRQLMATLGTTRTIVLSTHIVADLGAGCEQIALIDRGELAFDGEPRELLERADRVFEVDAGTDLEEMPGEGFEIVSRAASSDRIRLRGVVTGETPPAGARPVAAPTLEEAYLSFMAARGRAEVAQVETPQVGGER